MTNYTDFTFNIGEYGTTEVVTDSKAITLAIRNILLSRPGNYPFDPSFGMNIEKYQFELLDSTTINSIKTELTKQIAKYIPNLENVFVSVEKIDDSTTMSGIIGISVSSSLNGEDSTSNFLVYNKEGTLNIVNETY